MPAKPYQSIPIQDCGEPLVPIPLDRFAAEQPHPYERLGANYAGKSPFCLRKRVLDALIAAQDKLQHIDAQIDAQIRLLIFDAYRPIAVQQFMVDYSFAIAVQAQGLTPETLTPAQKQAIWEQVYQIWALPSDNPHTPPPHSTGAAIDLTLIDKQGQPLEMGGAIDEMSLRSQPHYYLDFPDPRAALYHQRRELLNQIMQSAGFVRHPGEWWHFSLGDQMWALQQRQQDIDPLAIAIYGRVD
jgi:D-alanyl-D-alanine dipeptidase